MRHRRRCGTGRSGDQAEAREGCRGGRVERFRRKIRWRTPGFFAAPTSEPFEPSHRSRTGLRQRSPVAETFDSFDEISRFTWLEETAREVIPERKVVAIGQLRSLLIYRSQKVRAAGRTRCRLRTLE